MFSAVTVEETGGVWEGNIGTKNRTCGFDMRLMYSNFESCWDDSPLVLMLTEEKCSCMNVS
jgi:hypothetical protein